MRTSPSSRTRLPHMLDEQREAEHDRFGWLGKEIGRIDELAEQRAATGVQGGKSDPHDRLELLR